MKKEYFLQVIFDPSTVSSLSVSKVVASFPASPNF
jgi:hypothetical protein